MHLLPFNLVEVTAQKLWVSGHCSPCALCLLCSVSCLISVRNPFPQPPSHHWTWGLLLVPATILTHTLNLKYFNIAAAAAKSLHSYLTLWDPIDGSPPGSPVPGILQARTLEWVAISFSNAWKGKVKVKSFSRVQLLATPWTAAYQAPPSMGFSRQEYWSGVPLSSPILTLECFKYYYMLDWNEHTAIANKKLCLACVSNPPPALPHHKTKQKLLIF